MRLVAITSASKPSIAINATQRAIKARIPSCMARPPEPRRPQRTNRSIPSIFGGEIGTGMRRDPQNLRRGPAHRRQHRQAAGFARRPRPPARIRHAACPKQRTSGLPRGSVLLVEGLPRPNLPSGKIFPAARLPGLVRYFGRDSCCMMPTSAHRIAISSSATWAAMMEAAAEAAMRRIEEARLSRPQTLAAQTIVAVRELLNPAPAPRRCRLFSKGA